MADERERFSNLNGNAIITMMVMMMVIVIVMIRMVNIMTGPRSRGRQSWYSFTYPGWKAELA